MHPPPSRWSASPSHAKSNHIQAASERTRCVTANQTIAWMDTPSAKLVPILCDAFASGNHRAGDSFWPIGKCIDDLCALLRRQGGRCCWPTTRSGLGAACTNKTKLKGGKLRLPEGLKRRAAGRGQSLTQRRVRLALRSKRTLLLEPSNRAAVPLNLRKMVSHHRHRHHPGFLRCQCCHRVPGG